MTLQQLWRIVLAWRWTIVAMTLMAVAVALIAARQLPERYTARARVLLDLFNADSNQFMVVDKNTVRPYVGTQIRLVSEYEVTGLVVDKLGWLNDPNVVTAWETETGGTGDLRRWAAARIADNTFAGTIGGSGILEIGYSATDPTYAARVAELLRQAYISQSLANRAAMAARAAVWAADRETKAAAALKVAEQTSADFAKANGILLNPQHQSVDVVELQQIQAMLTTRHGQSGSRTIEGMRSASGAPGVVRSKAQLAEMDQGLSVLSDRLGVQNPELKALELARERLQGSVARETAIARSTGAQFASLSTAEVAALEAKYRDKQRYILDHKAAYDQFSALQREAALRLALQQSAAQSLLSLNQMASISESGLVVFGDVVTDTKPSFPAIPLIGSLAALFGLALGVACTLFTELRERRVRGSEDLAFSSQAAVLCTVGGVEPGVGRWWPARPRFGASATPRWLPSRWRPTGKHGSSLHPAE